jgi:hypothetical protein
MESRRANKIVVMEDGKVVIIVSKPWRLTRGVST